jgi:hypothetical protein
MPVENSVSRFIFCWIGEIKRIENRSNTAEMEGISPAYSGSEAAD